MWLIILSVRLDPKKYAVDEAAVKAAYDKDKSRFKVDEMTKDVAFIAVNISPSAEDRGAARKLAEKTAMELRDSLGQISKESFKKEGIIVTHKEPSR